MPTWTSEQVTSLAPDPASVAAARGLASTRLWSGAGHEGRALWGRIRGYSVAVDLGRMSSVRSLDGPSSLVTVGPGMRGPALEEELSREGLTFGHLPQSWEFATLGGYAATRSAGSSNSQATASTSPPTTRPDSAAVLVLTTTTLTVAILLSCRSRATRQVTITSSSFSVFASASTPSTSSSGSLPRR